MNIFRPREILLALMTCSSLVLGGTVNWKTVVTSTEGYLDTITLPTDATQGLLLVNASPRDVAITPDGTLAFATVENYNGLGTAVVIFDLTQPLTTLSDFILLSGGTAPAGIAITPDGTVGVVVDSSAIVTFIDIVNKQVLGFPISVGTSPNRVGITVDGTKALITDNASNDMSVIDMATKSVSTLPVGGPTWGIAMTPDGRYALVTQPNNLSVQVIDLASMTVTKSITAPSLTNPFEIAITADGTVALVSVQGGNAVFAIDLGTMTVIGSLIQLSFITSTNPQGISITPDSKQAFVEDFRGNAVYVLDLTQLALLTSGTPQVIPTITVNQTPTMSAVTPDQAPTARFRFSIHDGTVFFNGSASTSPTGGIKSYIWDFGDGTSTTTTEPTVSHVYPGRGPFTASLTVVNDGGTSLDITFTGQTVSNHGGPSARTSTQILVGPDQPRHFVGKVHLHHKEKKAKVGTTWHKSTSKHVKKYEIFSRRTQKIATIKADHKLKKTLTLHPHKVPKHLSRKYRLYLHDKYAIRAVDKANNPSPFTSLYVQH